MKKFIAFTLAETLIVMGVIGIVSALTLPNLNSSTGDKEKVAKVKKIYQNLTDALGRAEGVYGPVSDWPSDNATAHFSERLQDFLKASKVCSAVTDCFSSKYTALNSETNDVLGNNAVLLADGTAVSFSFNPSCSTSNSNSESSPAYYTCGYIYIDLDGKKGANTFGKDYFAFYITSKGVYPAMTQDDNDSGFTLTRDCFPEGYWCTGWVINQGNMDYLKANGSGKCKNNSSITLDWTTNTTCK